MKDILLLQNSCSFLTKFILLRYWVSAGYFQRALADGSGMIRTQMGTHSRSVMDALLETPCTITPRYYKCNSRLRSSETLVITQMSTGRSQRLATWSVVWPKVFCVQDMLLYFFFFITIIIIIINNVVDHKISSDHTGIFKSYLPIFSLGVRRLYVLWVYIQLLSGL
jgi:hypothetical protein